MYIEKNNHGTWNLMQVPDKLIETFIKALKQQNQQLSQNLEREYEIYRPAGNLPEN